MLATGVAIALALAAGTSGLRGVVMRGPTQPVCMAGRPCTKPAANVTLTFTRGGVAHRVVSTRTGAYRIALRPGTYRLTIAGAQFGYAPHTVVVPTGRYAVRDVSIDTGIR
jgi:hypothetical protein